MSKLMVVKVNENEESNKEKKLNNIVEIVVNIYFDSIDFATLFEEYGVKNEVITTVKPNEY